MQVLLMWAARRKSASVQEKANGPRRMPVGQVGPIRFADYVGGRPSLLGANEPFEGMRLAGVPEG
jgi:hypothetical protein